ncbi:MAG: Acetyltransferase (GNAT) family protein [Pelotomaculum sp. PtaB.Bin117]|nr:MAG: Acetyltransferase (GNAT) family protein [Pelotomaculum sp. PtaB.Bin117]OPY63097.1 MAG: Acetyltransferase (GNAT) family protein [Pelotomaculum sp. PtaU1.Bin065]
MWEVSVIAGEQGFPEYQKYGIINMPLNDFQSNAKELRKGKIKRKINMLTISKANKQDIEEMCLLLQELFDLEKDFSSDWCKQRKGLELIIDNPQYGLLLLLKRDQEVLGMANLLITISTALGRKVILLEDFIVKKEERRKRLGSYFMEGIKDLVRKEGYGRIALLADKENKPAQEFYHTMGFQMSNMDCWRYVFNKKINI